MSAKTRKERAIIYEENYSEIPREYKERLSWMIEKYKISDSQVRELIQRKENMKSNLCFDEFRIILYEEPLGTPRPRYRVIGPKNYAQCAKSSQFIHVYQPRAHENHEFGKKLVDSDLDDLIRYIQTPFVVDINVYSKTPSYYSKSDKIMAEIGLDWNINKPDIDNLCKTYLDMFNSTIWLDDSLCIRGTVNKFYSILPRVEIFIKYLNCQTNKHQYDKMLSRVGYNDQINTPYLDKFGNPVIMKGQENEY